MTFSARKHRCFSNTNTTVEADITTTHQEQAVQREPWWWPRSSRSFSPSVRCCLPWRERCRSDGSRRRTRWRGSRQSRWPQRRWRRRSRRPWRRLVWCPTGQRWSGWLWWLPASLSLLQVKFTRIETDVQGSRDGPGENLPSSKSRFSCCLKLILSFALKDFHARYYRRLRLWD